MMILLVDPGAASSNLGDRIISEAAHQHLICNLQNRGVDVEHAPLHGPLTDLDRRHIRSADDVLVCGTNLLSDHMWHRSPWCWARNDVNLAAGKLTIFGAGWWQYQTRGIDWATSRWF